ncbi:synaptotagmin-like protein 2 isoform X3 [Misgurnus anguillicaudatus]|uniref:synaptotagmin-like protein 2 isoform X3 n=1 Tax=Misgurnus anguillicaudatus TaxID=75329 RepID=UPI003CCFB650
MIDLSYLTEEEKGMVLAVLNRDAKLKNLEEQRIKRLRKTEKDGSRLKYLTGEWFYETKYHRHRDRVHVSDIIRASMGQRKPYTISELSNRWDEKPSLVNSERRDVFIPPELMGLIEDPSTQSRNDRLTSPSYRVDDQKFPEAQQERQRSQIKPRQNPFNIMRYADRHINGVKEAEQAPTEEPLLAAKSSTPYNAIQNTDNTETHVCTQCTVPKNRLLLNSGTDSHLDTTDGDPSVIQGASPAHRGIFKAHDCFSCSSTGSILDPSICPISLEIPISPPLSPCTMQSVSEWLDRKQVHVSPIVRPIESEKGEHSVLDEDWSPLVDEDKEPDKSDTMKNDNHELYAEPQSTQVSNFNSTAEVTGKAIQLDTKCHTRKVTEEERFGQGSQDAALTELKSPVESEKNQEEPNDHGTLDVKLDYLSPPVVQPKTKPSPKPRRGLFALFSRAEEKDKSLEVLVLDEEVTSQDKERSECQTTCTLRTEADDNVDLQEESKMTEILQVPSKAVDGNKKGSAVCEYDSQNLGLGEVSPGRLANLKSFWERGNEGPKILSVKKRDVIPESETSLLNENYNLDLRFNLSGSKPSDPIPNPVHASEYPVDIESTTGMMYDLSSNEDAKLSDLDGSKISACPNNKQQSDLVKTNVKLLSPNSVKSGSDMQEEVLAESLSREISDLKEEISTFQISLSPQKNKISINDLKSFWEEEKSGLEVNVGSPTCASNTKESSRESSPQCSSIELSKSPPDVTSDSPDLSSLDRMSLSLNKDVDLLVTQEEIDTIEKKHSPSRVPEQDHQDFTGDSAEHSPVQAALERASARPISISKSLEDLPSTPSSSTVASNTSTSFSDPEQMKMISLSVPTFINQEMDYRNSDCASVSSLQFDRQRACNASPAFNICSEGTSMSSVTGSVTSINSGEFGNVPVKGTIQFAINYLEKLEDFHIFVVKCKDLAVADPKRNRSDPYVKCYLLPDKAKFGKRKTCVRKKTLDPTYNEILRFKIPMETLKTQKLNVSVWHNDTFGHNSCLGEVEIDLAEWDFSATQMNEYLLKGRVQVPRSPKHSACSEEMIAEMRLALRFLQQTSHSHKTKANGEVQILVKECKNLPISRGVSMNPFVKCTVLPDTSRKSRQKTRVVKRSSNPEFNHTLVYEGFRPEDLKEACVELTVWDHERLHSHFIGGIRLGPGTGKSYGAEVDWMDSNSAEAALWEKMMQSHNEWVEGVLPLRMLLMAKKSAST